MGKDNDLLQAVKDQDIHTLQRILAKSRQHKTKLIGSGKKLNVNHQDQDGMAALHQAALVGNTEIMNLLLGSSAAADIKDVKGMRPLHYAAWQGKEEPVDILLKWGSSSNEPAADGETPLHLACQHGHYEVVNLLLYHRGDPTIHNKKWKTPLDLACEFGKYRVVELLLNSNLCSRLLYDSDDDLVDNHRTTCLHLAAKNGHGDIIKLLLQAGVDINRQTHQGTCLHEAALCGKTDVVKLLIDCGIDVNRPNSYDQTALDIVNKFTTSRAGKELKQLLKDASYTVIARAIKDHYHIHDSSALTFREGDYITVLEQRCDGIWKGRIIHDGHMSKAGYFPSSAVMLIEKDAVNGGHSGSSPHGVGGMSLPRKTMTPQVPDLLNPATTTTSSFHTCAPQCDHSPYHSGSSYGSAASSPYSSGGSTYPGGDGGGGATNGGSTYNSVGMDKSFPPPPSPLIKPKGSPSQDSDRDSGISPQQHYPPHGFPGQGYQASPTSPEYGSSDWVGGEWYGRHILEDGRSNRSNSPCRDSPGSSNRNSSASSSSAGYVPNHPYVNVSLNSQHRLSGQSYESGVSGVTVSSRASYHSGSSSSLGSLDRLEESGYSSTVNVHELFQQGISDPEILRAWLADLHFEEYYNLFIQAGYDMPTISRMTPEDLTAIGITKPAHRKKLKAEISKLHIHDGIPEYKPGSIAEWLQVLNLEQYFDCLMEQGYHEIDDVTDITWEDLEEIGISLLGHQKKISLAIERLKRLQTSSHRLSTLEQHPPGEMLEPPSSYPTPLWIKTEHSKSSSGSMFPAHELALMRCKPMRSPSGENLSSASAAAELGTTFSQMNEGGGFDSSGHPSSCVYQPDVVAIQVNRSAPTRTSTADEAGQLIYQSFHGPMNADHVRTLDQSDGEQTPTDNRSSDEMDSSTLRRPSAKVSPRIAPKPKPIAKIMAKSKRASLDYSSDLVKLEKLESESDTIVNPGYSGTLGRKSSFHAQEPIYDLPAEIARTVSAVSGGSGGGSGPSSPGGNLYAVSAVGHQTPTKKAPPPPPKRTNSIKSDINILHSRSEKPTDSELHAMSLPLPASPAKSNLVAIRPQQDYAKCVENLSQQFSGKEADNESLPEPPLDYSPPQQDEFPPPPPPIVPDSPVTQFKCSTPTERNPLTEAIQQLERTAGTLPRPKKSKWRTHEDGGSDSDTGFETMRRKQTLMGSESTTSICSTESNTLPFANEDVGTIKQRNSAAKPSILTVNTDEDGVERTDVDKSFFDESMGTLKRKPSQGQPTAEVQPLLRGAEARKVPPPTPKRRDSIKGIKAEDIEKVSVPSPPKKPGDSADVLNDIGNMLQDLTDELDAMLEFEL